MNSEDLAKAISRGKSYHIFDPQTGEYLGSSYFPSTAANLVVKFEIERRRNLVVKYLTNQLVSRIKSA